MSNQLTSTYKGYANCKRCGDEIPPYRHLCDVCRTISDEKCYPIPCKVCGRTDGNHDGIVTDEIHIMYPKVEDWEKEFEEIKRCFMALNGLPIIKRMIIEGERWDKLKVVCEPLGINDTGFRNNPNIKDYLMTDDFWINKAKKIISNLLKEERARILKVVEGMKRYGDAPYSYLYRVETHGWNRALSDLKKEIEK